MFMSLNIEQLIYITKLSANYLGSKFKTHHESDYLSFTAYIITCFTAFLISSEMKLIEL